MKFVTTLALSLTCLILSAQNFIDKNYSKYIDMEQTTVVHVSPRAFELATYVIPDNDEAEREIKEFVASVHSLDLIQVPDMEAAKTEARRGMDILRNGYDELVNVREQGDTFSLFIDADDDIVYEVVGIGANDDEFFVVSITGKMRLDIIASVINNIQSDNFAPIAKLKEFDATEFGIYPNPVNGSSLLTVEIPESMLGGKGTIYDLKGGALRKFDLDNLTHKLKTNGLEPGTYIVGLEKGEKSMQKQIIVVQ